MSTCVLVACCLHSLVSTETFRRRALTASVDSYKEFPFSGITNSDRVWMKVAESDARGVASPSPLTVGTITEMDGGDT